MPDKKRLISNELGEFISLADFLAIIDLLIEYRPIYVDKWNIIEKGKVKTTTLTNIFGKTIGIKTNVTLYIENLGDRVTIYGIEACFIDSQNSHRIAAHNIVIKTNCHREDRFIVLDKGDVVEVNIEVILKSNQIDSAINSLENLELLFKATGGSKNRRFPL